MPFKSEKQRKYMFAKHPEIAERWAKEGKANVERKAKPVAKKVAAAKKMVEKRGEGRYKALPVIKAAKKAADKKAPKRAASYKRSK